MPLLLGVVSDRTGYPAEMLSSEMELESDLGIDSIKRVEILSAMQDLVPGLPDVDLAVMASLATLGEIVDYLSSQMGTTAAGDTTDEPIADDGCASVRSDGSSCRASRPRRRAPPTPGLFDGRVVVTDDGGGVAAGARRAPGRARRRRSSSRPAADPRDHVGLIYLGNLRTASDVDAAIALNRDAFDAAQDFASAGIDGGLFVVVDDQRGASGVTAPTPPAPGRAGSPPSPARPPSNGPRRP